MWWVLVAILFAQDPKEKPDTGTGVFATQALCDAQIAKIEAQLRKDDGDGYGAAKLSCEPVSDPRTEKSA